MIKSWHVVVFALALLAFALARAPVTLIASRMGGLAYERAEGTIWNAQLRGTKLAGMDAGDATWRLSLFGLLNGKFVADIGLHGAEVRGQARLLGNYKGDRRIAIAQLVLRGAPLAPGLRLAGETEFDHVDIFFRAGRCETATGEARSDVLANNGATLHWEGPTLIGVAQCDGLWGRLPLVGGGDDERVVVTLSFRGDGEAEWQVRAETAREGALAAAGLVPDPGGGMSKSVQWRWFPF